MGKTTNGYPMYNPKGAKPMSDPQLDMRTWKEPGMVEELKKKKDITVPPLKQKPGQKSYYA